MSKKKKKEIIIGTNNKGKLREIKDLIPKSYLISSPKEYGYRSPKENGNSFLKNSLIKAKYYFKKSGKICIADDSGLEIYALNKNIISLAAVDLIDPEPIYKKTINNNND